MYLEICHRKKKVIAKIRGKVENFTLNPYLLDNFTYNMEQSQKRALRDIQIYIQLLILVIKNVFRQF